MSAFNILDLHGMQIGALDESTLLEMNEQNEQIRVNQRGLSQLVAALGEGFMETPFSLQQDAVTYRGCRITSSGSRGATVRFDSVARA